MTQRDIAQQIFATLVLSPDLIRYVEIDNDVDIKKR